LSDNATLEIHGKGKAKYIKAWPMKSIW
jgi:hypothetical protein